MHKNERFEHYTSEDLSNDRYHSAEFPQASGSELAVIHSACPAELRYGEKKETASMSTGIAGHVALLEPELFSSKYARGIDPDEHPDALVTNKDLEGYLRDVMGRKGYSGKKKDELIAMIHDAGESPKILECMIREHEFECQAEGMEIVPAKVFDTVTKMRAVIFQNGYGDLLSSGFTEQSIIDLELGYKVRLDFHGEYNGGPVIVDYKTTSNAHPEIFAAQAYRMNYWLKMALQFDVYFNYFGVEPRVILLAQSTKPPYIAQAYELTSDQLDVGREQYLAAKRYLDRCKAADVWPAYGGGIQELLTPGYIANEFGFEDKLEIIQE